MATEKIMIGVDDQVMEVKGTDKESILAEQKVVKDNALLLEAEYQAKRDSRESAIKKLAEIAGLTEEELSAIL